jgi:magnesium transporter
MINYKTSKYLIKDILQNSASKILITHIPIAHLNSTIEEVINLILNRANEFESINYIYVIDDNNKLKGVVPIKKLFKEPKNKAISHYITKKLITVHPHTHQETVAFTALSHNIKSVPVVDQKGQFLGIVPPTAIFATLYKEAREDMFRLAGVHHSEAKFDNVLKISIFKSLKHRLPWLILGLLGGILSAKIVENFENTLSTNLILAAFIPLIVYMADAVGTQMEAFIIRDLAINKDLNFVSYFIKQTSIIILIAFISSLCLLIINSLIYKNNWLAIVLSLSLFIAIASSTITGLMIPYIFNKFKLDPANASGPIATIIQDVLSIIIYFSIANWLL